MTAPANQTLQIQGLLDRLRAGDESAREELLGCACQRLTCLARKMLRSYPRIRRWEETDDVFQNATLRLYRALAEVRPTSVVEFFRLAALNVRRELLDLAKHYYGARGLGAHHASVAAAEGESGDSSDVAEPLAPQEDSEHLAAWAALHEQVDKLPDEEREVFDLLWYQELSQAEAAALLGVSDRTIKRRWQSARLLLHQALGGALPDA
jgi:RNA polymerase sigma-70 factor (ECF subfamily)